MIHIRPANERGQFDFGWLKTSHSFSFGDYRDPEHMGFSDLRVINEDYVEPGQGFATHPHKDMEIVTYILEGALAHKDSVGNAATIHRGEVQRMSAGTGITHSEFNASKDEGVELLQLWILPDRKGHKPGYEQKLLSADVKNGLAPIASPDGRGDSVSINQDAIIYAGQFDGAAKVEHKFSEGRRGWVQVARGAVTINDVALKAGDGAAIDDEDKLVLDIDDGGAELLLFDLR
ncbi:MAG: pirin family protein [Sphingomonadales bacterium]|jgi:redox-sensitive bicupin YhaK (pirin superfamily)